MQRSMTFNQRHWPGAGDTDDCFAVSALQCVNMVAPWLRLVSIPVARKACANPDQPGPTGGNLADVAQIAEVLWPRYFKGHVRILRGALWSDFAAAVDRGVPVSVATVSAKLPTRMQFGFAGFHQISIARGSGGRWLVFNPLAPVYSRPIEADPLELKPAVMAYGRSKVGTSGAWAVVFPTAEHCAALYFGEADSTPYDQDDIDAATQAIVAERDELAGRIEDARDVLDGVVQ